VAAVFERPALLVTAVAATAFVGVLIGQVIGRPVAQHASIVLPALVLAAFEALCVLGGYVALGRSLGLRGGGRDFASEERPRA
jgi:hypothetical protein